MIRFSGVCLWNEENLGLNFQVFEFSRLLCYSFYHHHHYVCHVSLGRLLGLGIVVCWIECLMFCCNL